MSLRYKYQTLEFDEIDIHLRTLRDRREFEDIDGIAASMGISSAAWPIFGVVWPSSIVLAHHLHLMDLKNLRVLEVGCGIGLPSILLNHLCVDITATDHHPEANLFLEANARLNDDKHIPFERIEWQSEKSALGLFDVIIGSDLLYEDQHIEELASFIVQHAAPKSKIILVDPGRGRKTKFRKKMQESNFEWSEIPAVSHDSENHPYRGYILTLTRDI